MHEVEQGFFHHVQQVRGAGAATRLNRFDQPVFAIELAIGIEGFGQAIRVKQKIIPALKFDRPLIYASSSGHYTESDRRASQSLDLAIAFHP